MKTTSISLSVLLFLIVELCGSWESQAQPRAAELDDFSRPAAKEWPMVGGDWNNSRYSILTRIDAKNVKTLGVAWVSKNFDEGGETVVTPVVRNGLMFVAAGREVYALNAKTGDEVWSYKTVPDVPADISTLSPQEQFSGDWNSPYGVPNMKGVGLGHGLVFVGLRDGRVIALGQKTGDLVWSHQTGIDAPKKGQWADSAPTYFNGIVFTGLSDGDHHQRGRLTALDAMSGQQLWQKFSIPAPGEPGHETWPSFNDAWRFGGGGVFTNPPVDPALGTVYFTTGNAVPPFAGNWRPGSNLYTCSVLAVDIKTGRLKWYYQLVHHDIFDGDVGVSVILYDAHVNGKARKALAVLRVDGYLFLLDRETGKPLLPVEERPVPQLASQLTSPTQPFPVDGESILRDCETWRKAGIPAGFQLSCMWTPPAAPNDPPNVLSPGPGLKGYPMAYSPLTGYFYAQGISYLHWPRRSEDPYYDGFSGVIPDEKIYWELAAIDGRTGKVAWKKTTPLVYRNGGPIATASGLVFRALGDGNVEAFDAKTGDVLWRFQTGMYGAAGAISTYELDGQQYIAVAMGPAVWAFRLGGQASTAAPAVATTQSDDFDGPVIDTHEIGTTTLARSREEPGMRYFHDEYTFDPYRARVKVGEKVLFVNSGLLPHEVVALDGSWGTGPLSPTQEAWVSFDKPGRYTYVCKDHPWSYGQIVVVTPAASTLSARARQGKASFSESCGTCHGEDLKGRGASPALIGASFLTRWKSAPVGDLFDKIRTTMPQASPGSLNAETYQNITTFLLEVNEIGSSETEAGDAMRKGQ